ncbi:hypothetical protein LZ518_11335 [Sphingomonas sp. RB56-2]|uniref:Uncharacterized protein n=1 Tax=Sphingomonas brevis TaxID=2908206 RepID=A0ABT0SC70_9SPHN|nr:hypothetical protein [Sphingomonas brevis]MCL6741719.1 hypothetical protein [Sphingomonas brevis]
MRAFPVISCAIALASTAAFAEENPNEDKIVCKRAEADYTGSHLSRPKKVCKKQSEWKQMDQDKEQTMSKLRDGRLSPDQSQGLGTPR